MQHRKKAILYRFGFLMLCGLFPSLYAQTAQSDPFDPNAYYRLTTKLQGTGMSMEAAALDEDIRLGATGDYSNQYWKVRLEAGCYRLTTMWMGAEKSLEVANDGKNNDHLTLADTGDYTRQCWKITPQNGEYFRLTTKWQGDGKSLGVSAGSLDVLRLHDTGNFTNQMWKFTRLNNPSSCASNEICKSFEVAKEYTNYGTKANGVCESWLRGDHCAMGIPRDALAHYEIEIQDGKIYDKFNRRPFTSWAGGYKETLYVIDATNDKIYFVNVDGRYIEARGSANCIDQSIADGQSTYNCTIPRLTTHAGILMGYLAGEPGNPSTHNALTIKVKGAGTVKVVNGVIEEITNDSGHFKPTTENLKIAMNIFTKKGFISFPPMEGCSYDFMAVPGKDGVFSQSNTQLKCELRKR